MGGRRSIRAGQLIVPFGPGALYTDRDAMPFVIGGLDRWFCRPEPGTGASKPCEDKAEFARHDARLARLVRVDRFYLPPDFRPSYAFKGSGVDKNLDLTVPVYRFPTWYRHTKTGAMRQFRSTQVSLDKADGGRWQPVRFIAVCAAGHMSDFPWQAWLGCTCAAGIASLELIDLGGSELSSIKVCCRTCNKKRDLGGTTRKPADGERSAFAEKGISCPGHRPWLDDCKSDALCGEQLVGALINQSNIYLPLTVSGVVIPERQVKDDLASQCYAVLNDDPHIAPLKAHWKMGPDYHELVVASAVKKLAEQGIVVPEAKVRLALEAICSDIPLPAADDEVQPEFPELPLARFRRSEREVLKDAFDDAAFKDLRIVKGELSIGLKPWFRVINRVERLRELRVFCGFDRLEGRTRPLDDMPERALKQLFRNPPAEKWLPAAEVFGEGIYLELDEQAIVEWQSSNASWLDKRISDEFIGRAMQESLMFPPIGETTRQWVSRFLVVHSLAHALIAQLTFESGYSTASLRERLFVSSDPKAPMAGILVYTAAGDSEGTLGGLVRLARPEFFEPLLRKAIGRLSWCSADPICAEEHGGGKGARRLNLAACHACVMLPETCCETINNGLDRAMLVGTPTERARGFMSRLLDDAMELDEA